MPVFDANDSFEAGLAYGRGALPFPGRVLTRRRGFQGPGGCLLGTLVVTLLALALVSFAWNIMIGWGPTFVAVKESPTLIVESVSNLRAVIHIHAGNTGGHIILRPVRPLDWPFGPPEVYQETSDLRTVVYDVSTDVAGTFDLTVPARINLKVDANRASVLVEGITGQMALNVISGTLTVRDSTILGPSLLRDDSGEIHAINDQLRGSVALDDISAGITFQGSLAPAGSYQFTGNGSPITLSFGSQTSAHIDATTNNGSIASNLPGAGVQATVNGFALHLDIGSPPRAQISLYNNGGSITINEQGGV